MVELITGTAGKDHVSSADFGSYNAGIIGEGVYILPRGKRLLCEKISDNLVKINDGDMVFKGRHIRIEPEDYEEVTIENGASGTKRHDLICIRVEKNEDTQIETAYFVVVKGEFADTPVDPEYTKGTILENDYLVDEYPICRVVLNGLRIESVIMLITETKTISKLMEDIQKLDTEKANAAATYAALSGLANSTNELRTQKADAAETNASLEELGRGISHLDSSKAEQTEFETLKSSVTELSASKASQADMDALESSVAGLSTSKAEQVDLDSLEDSVAELNTSKASQTELDALEKRMDAFEALPDGSTAGNEELLDIRNGADGVTYESAGKAVRTQFENVNDRIDNLTETVTTTDTTLNGSKASTLKIDGIRGKSEQKTFTGKQLLNCSGLSEKVIKGITYTPVYAEENDKDGYPVGALKYVNVNGTATELSSYNMYPELENNSYILSGCPSGGSNLTYCLTIQTTTSGGNYNWHTDSGSSKSFTLSDTETYLHCYIQIASGVTVTNLKFCPMIRLASVTDPTYEPYVGGMSSPNPLYKQDIKSVGDSGSLMVTAHGKNYFNKNNAKSNSAFIDGNGKWIEAGDSFSVRVSVKPNTIYTASIESGYSGLFRLGCLNSEEIPSITKYLQLKNVIRKDSYKPITVTTADDTKYIVIQVGKSTAEQTLSLLQVEESETATPYEPHTETSFTIPLSEPLRSIDDDEDEAVKQDNLFGALRNIEELVLNGGRTWSIQGSDGDSCCMGISLLSVFGTGVSKRKMLCSHFTVVEDAQKGRVAGTCSFNPSAEYSYWAYFNVPYSVLGVDSTATSTEKSNAFNAWLTENPTTVTFKKVEPYFEPFPDEVQALFYELESYEGVTHITTDSEVQPTIEMEHAVTDAGVHALNNYAKSNIANLTADKANELAQKADINMQSVVGKVMITNSTVVTENKTLVLDAVQNNPSIEGTLAWKIAKASTDAPSTEVTVNTSFIGSSNYELHKAGSCAMFSATFSLGRQSTIGSPLFTMPEDYIPISPVYGLICKAETSDVYNFTLDTNGDIGSDAEIPVGTYQITATYLCAE